MLKYPLVPVEPEPKEKAPPDWNRGEWSDPAPASTLPFLWTSLREKACIALAQGQMNGVEICQKYKINQTTLHRWRHDPAFIERLNIERENWRQGIRDHGIAQLENRVAAGQDRHERMNQVIAERAEQMAGEAPGGGTGLLVRKIKPLKDGGYATEYAVDTGLLGEMRATEKQVAQELGQWTESTTPAGRGLPAGATIGVRVLVGVDIDLL